MAKMSTADFIDAISDSRVWGLMLILFSSILLFAIPFILLICLTK